MMNEIIFLVEETDSDKYTATAMGRAIVIEAHSWNELKSLAKNSILEFFKNEKYPQSILLHLVREEIITL